MSLFNEVYDDLIENKELRESGKLIALPWEDLPELNNIIPGIERERYSIITASSKVGKCLSKGTKVIMYDGTFKNVENLLIGDNLLGGYGDKKTILSLAKGKEQMYWIHQSKAMSYRVNESHILSLRNPKTLSISNQSVKTLLNSKTILNKGYKGIINGNSIIDFDPYLLGIWLGDGSSDAPAITNIDSEIIDYFTNFADINNLLISKKGITYFFRAKKILHRLDENKKLIKVYSSVIEAALELNTKAEYISRAAKNNKVVCNSYWLWENKRNIFLDFLQSNNLILNKHIPNKYLTTTIKNKLELLAGLIDSDGYNQKGKSYEITSISKTLAYNIIYLANSLGFNTSIKEKISTMKRKDGSIYSVLIYRILIKGENIYKIPCKVKRKKILQKKRKNSDSIIKIEKDIVDNYYGFTLDGDGLFLLEDFTVTHNTQLADFLFLYQPLKYFLKNPNCGIVPKIFYFSLEVSQERKMQQAIVNKLFEDKGLVFSPQEIDSKFKNFILTDSLANEIDNYRSYFNDFFLKHVTFVQNIKNPFGIYNYMRHYAESNGQYYDKDGKILTSEEMKRDESKRFLIDRYEPNNKEELVIVITDHISLLQEEVNNGTKMTKHETMSMFSHRYCLAMRDRWHYHVVNIQQQSADVEKQQFTFKGESIVDKLKPSPDGLGDCKLTGRDVNYMFGLFAPNRYQQIHEYKGFNIDELNDNYREFSIILNREGSGFINMNLYFNGACTIFKKIQSNNIDMDWIKSKRKDGISNR